MHVFTTLTPVLVMILLGFLLRRYNFFSEKTVSELSWMVYWVGLPCLLFYKAATSTLNLAVCGRIYAVLLISLITCIIIAYIFSAAFRIPSKSVSAVVQGAFRGNLAYIGLPVVIYSFSNTSAQTAAEAETTAVFILALMVFANNAFAVVLFLLHQHRFNRQSIPRIARNILTNPLLISLAAGLIVALFTNRLPIILDRTLSAISQMVLPLALISVGASISVRKINFHLCPAALSSFVKLAICPIAGYLVACYLIPLSPEHLRLAMIFMACPTAAASYILAQQLGGDHELTATIVGLSSILSIISLSLVVGIF